MLEQWQYSISIIHTPFRLFYSCKNISYIAAILGITNIHIRLPYTICYSAKVLKGIKIQHECTNN